MAVFKPRDDGFRVSFDQTLELDAGARFHDYVAGGAYNDRRGCKTVVKLVEKKIEKT